MWVGLAGGGWVNLPAAIIYDTALRAARLEPCTSSDDPMKKKSPRGIPDFSSKGPKSLPVDKLLRDKAPKPVFDQPKVKPAATNQKSGRRGA